MTAGSKKKWCSCLFFLLVLITTNTFASLFGPPHAKFSLSKTYFTFLPNWQKDDHSQALYAFKQSCREIVRRNPKRAFSWLKQSGSVHDWQVICVAANKISESDPALAKEFFEYWFVPHTINNNFTGLGLFTGYYLPELKASLKQSSYYQIPIYGLPSRKILHTYPDRAAINKGVIHSQTPVLAWGNSIVDLFFAQVQGSAVVHLPDHRQFIINYAGNNGHPYTSIGKILVDSNALTKESVSMQAIRKWLIDHPGLTHSLLNQNASYVFFRILNMEHPLGREQVPLTPRRSLAVDIRYIPLGAPIWLDTTTPHPTKSYVPFQKILIAQDTGGAIKGMVRGDVYWGSGDEAAFIAGHMQNPGRYWILLPRYHYKS